MTEVTRTPNYTDEMVNAMVADYQDNPTKDTVAKLASEFNKSTRSIVAKLVREGVYVAAPRVTKTGAPVIRKSEIVSQIQDALGVELATLEKASKADLEKLLWHVAGESKQCLIDRNTVGLRGSQPRYSSFLQFQQYLEYNMGCRAAVEQTVPNGFDYKVLVMKCGDTSIYGDELRCDKCSQVRPWYICKHGRDVSEYDCGACEFDQRIIQ